MPAALRRSSGASAPGARRPARRRAAAGRARAAATASRWRGDGVPRRRGRRAGQGALGAERGPVLDGGAHERGERGAARRRRSAASSLGRRLERDQEVRGDRGRRVVGGAVGVDDLDGAHARGARASASGGASARGVDPATAAAAPANVGAVLGARSSAGAAEGLVPAERVERRGAGAVADAAARAATRPAAAAISPSGTHSSTTSAPAPSAPRPSGPCHRDRASRRPSASARPRRPRPTIATEHPSCIGGGPSSK